MNTTVLTSVRLTRIRRKNFLPLKILVKYYLEREFERLLITYGLKSLTCYPPFLCGYTFLQLTFKRDAGERCVEVCKKKYSLKKADDKKKLDFLKKGIKLNYQHHWYELKFSIVDGYLLVFLSHGGFRILDNMPITWCYDVESNQKFCSTGFPLGCYVTPAGKQKDACVISVSLPHCFISKPFLKTLELFYELRFVLCREC